MSNGFQMKVNWSLKYKKIDLYFVYYMQVELRHDK